MRGSALALPTGPVALGEKRLCLGRPLAIARRQESLAGGRQLVLAACVGQPSRPAKDEEEASAPGIVRRGQAERALVEARGAGVGVERESTIAGLASGRLRTVGQVAYVLTRYPGEVESAA